MKTLFATLIITILFIGCKKDRGEFISLEIDYPEFNSIILNGSENVNISYGATQKVVVSGFESDVSTIKNKVLENTLHIDRKDELYVNFDDKLQYEITIPIVKTISVEGSGDLLINEFTQNDDLDLKVNGSGTINFDKFHDIEEISAKITGSGSIKALSGFSEVKTLYVSITGSGDFVGYGVKAKDATAKITGSGDIEVFAIETLKARITGSGSIHYKGFPVIDLNITGSGDIHDDN